MSGMLTRVIRALTGSISPASPAWPRRVISMEGSSMDSSGRSTPASTLPVDSGPMEQPLMAPLRMVLPA
jgi:hypothetical protein